MRTKNTRIRVEFKNRGFPSPPHGGFGFDKNKKASKRYFNPGSYMSMVLFFPPMALFPRSLEVRFRSFQLIWARPSDCILKVFINVKEQSLPHYAYFEGFLHLIFTQF
jgi:hypothetical protein